jgi:hypothetical protein
MLPGDVIAFGGYSMVSDLTKCATDSAVSHVAVIESAAGAGGHPVLVESTLRDAKYGVQRGATSTVIEEYPGDVWWLPLDRAPFDESAFLDFLGEIRNHLFDPAGGLVVNLVFLLRRLGRINLTAEEDLAKLFCSELVAEALERSGRVGQVNSSAVAPIDVCRWNIFRHDYYILKWRHAPQPEISGFNTVAAATEQLREQAKGTVNRIAGFARRVSQEVDLFASRTEEFAATL